MSPCKSSLHTRYAHRSFIYVSICRINVISMLLRDARSCLLSRRPSTSLLRLRRPLGFLLLPPKAPPFAHCPSAARRSHHHSRRRRHRRRRHPWRSLVTACCRLMAAGCLLLKPGCCIRHSFCSCTSLPRLFLLFFARIRECIFFT